uniref:Protein phosphatase 1, regulatory (inhibitor) subunit 14Bb n=1 Tax=Sparus aurata TaxID=8175 RepID=A0A671YZG1_SPAAU
MAAVTSPETSPQPRVYFQTPAGTTEEPETPVRKQGRVTVKYDRKELRKRLNLEEWIIDQLTDLYDCEVKTPTITRRSEPINVSIRRLFLSDWALRYRPLSVCGSLALTHILFRARGIRRLSGFGEFLVGRD